MKHSKFLITIFCGVLLLFLAYPVHISPKHFKPVSIVDYASLECSDSRDFFIENGDLLLELSNSKIISYEFKPIDLPDFQFDGEIFKYMTPSHLELNSIADIFKNQDTWSSLDTFQDIKNTLNLSPSLIQKNIKILEDTKAEASNLHIKEYPGIFIDGEIIPYTIKNEDLYSLVFNKFKNKNYFIWPVTSLKIK